jgi:hypothetical protein
MNAKGFTIQKKSFDASNQAFSHFQRNEVKQKKCKQTARLN